MHSTWKIACGLSLVGLVSGISGSENFNGRGIAHSIVAQNQNAVTSEQFQEEALTCAWQTARKLTNQPMNELYDGELYRVGQSFALAEVAIRYVDAGQLERAMQLNPIILEELGGQKFNPALDIDDDLNFERFFAENLQSQVLAEIALGYARAGQKAKAMDLFSQATQMMPDPYFPDILDRRVEALLEAGFFEQALEIVRSLEYDFQKLEPLKAIARADLNTGQIERVLQVAQSIEYDSGRDEARAQSEKAEVLSVIAIAYAKAGQFEQALQVARSLDRLNQPEAVVEKAKALIEIAIAYANTGQSQQAAPLKEEALQLLSQVSAQMDLNNRWLLADINATYTLAGETDRALALLSRYAQLGWEDRASESFKQAVEAVQLLPEYNDSPPELPRARALSGMALEYTEIGQYERAFELAKTLKTTQVPFLGEPAYLIGAYLELGQLDRALQVIQAIDLSEDSAWIPNIQESLKTQQFERAFQWVEKLDSWGYQTQQLGEIAQATTDTRHLERILQIVRSFKSDSSNEEELDGDNKSKYATMGKVALRYAQLGQFDRALEVARLIPTDFAQIGDEMCVCSLFSQDKSLLRIAVELYAVGQPSKAAEIFEPILQKVRTIPSNSKQAKALAEIAVRYSTAGQNEKATELFNEANRLAQAIPPEYAKIKQETLDYIATARECMIWQEYVETGQFRRALQLLPEFKRQGTLDDGSLLRLVHSAIVAGENESALQVLPYLSRDEAKFLVLLDTQQLDGAQQLLEKFVNEPQDASSANEVITELSGEFLSQYDLTNNEGRIEAFAALAAAYGRAGQLEKSQQIFARSRQLSQPLIEPNHSRGDQSYVLSVLAYRYAQAGNREEALALLEQIQQLSQSLKMDFFGDPTLVKIAQSYIDTGQFDRAINVVEAIAGDYPKANVLAAIAIQAHKTEQPVPPQVQKILTQLCPLP
jgi:tetratricopeptide (TPR) repeat protein